MLSAALARSACQPCSSHTAAHHRVLTLIVPAPVCSCQTHPFCLPSPSSAHLNRRTLRQCSRQKLRTSCASTEAEPAESPVGRNGFEWATNVSRHGNVYFAIDETSQACVASMDDSAAEPTVALFFASSSYSVEFDRIVPVLRSKVPSLQHIIGCTGFGVIGGSTEGPQEVEGGEAALSLTLGVLPGVQVAAHHISDQQVPDADSRQELWQEVMQAPIDIQPNHSTSFVVLADPTFHRVTDLLAGLDYAYPEAVKIGGFVSSATQTAKRALFCWSGGTSQPEDGIVKEARVLELYLYQQAGHPLSADTLRLDEVFSIIPAAQSEPQHVSASRPVSPSIIRLLQYCVQHQCWKRLGGAAVLSLQGPLKIEPIVAQGCRPLTDSTWLVDKSENNIILQVRGVGQPSWKSMAPLAALQHDLCSLPSTDREDVSNNLTLAVAPDDFKDESQLDANDFLIRGIIGIDPQGGAIAVGDTVGVGKRIRFMVRDKAGAKQDLQNHALAYKRRELQASMEGKSPGQAFGALIFTCNGRGRNLFGEPHYDSRKVAEFIPVPSSGFLCNGEIGQVANSTALHGFTCAVGVLRASPCTDD